MHTFQYWSLVLLHFFFVGNSNTVHCQVVHQDPDTSAIKAPLTLGQTLTEDFKDYYKGFGYVFSRPAHWKKKQLLTFGGVMAGTLLLTLADEPVYEFFRDNQGNFGNDLEKIGDFWGKPQFGYLFAGGIYALGLGIGREPMRKAGVSSITAITAAGLLQTITKIVVGRARPGQDKGNWFFSPFTNEAKFHSFPSGHTIVAMTTSFVIAKTVESKVVKGVFYTLGGLTAWSRVYKGAHWLSDVALSTAISYFTVETVFKFMDLRTELRKKKHGGTVFRLSPHPLGFTASLQW
ncbi:MAG: phosphatase PAP2 family protein [Bacteroidetes bacterium]|nr:phosphatase PAP2 family protein [Bacteroidota bacterium]